MIQVHPVVVDSITMRTLARSGPPAMPARCRAHAAPVARLEWWSGQPLPAGVRDCAELVESFLRRHGLEVGDLAAPHTEPPAARGRHVVCGAALYLSAAAGAALVHGPPGRPTPAPEVPDVVAIVYAEKSSPTTQSDDLGSELPLTPAESGHGSIDSAPGADRCAQVRAETGAGRRADWKLGTWRPSWTPGEHAEAVAHVRDAIAAGDVYQVNVVGHAAAAYAGDPLAALRRLATLRGARYGGLLTGEGWAVACASPETLVAVRDGVAVTRPIKGTAAATAEGRQALLTSAKERAEHVMIVDLERNDLARVARTGSVCVDELYALRRWGDLWQAESTVSARLRPGLGLAELLRAVCPGGSVTGAPKLAALAQIAELEPVGRGAAMGALGWVGHDHLDLGLTIRTVAATSTDLHLWAGGGITWGSDPAAEVAEAAAKAAPLRRLLAT
jgi:para-aminobenzoate synthetase component 1